MMQPENFYPHLICRNKLLLREEALLTDLCLCLLHILDCFLMAKQF